ncbi:hypothetical protein B0H13DRAFT_1918097 [Mycena leptocephala]|nr:hypothetical protein B0H13DRAFT_1918097 [Mycena leptocephala]
MTPSLAPSHHHPQCAGAQPKLTEVRPVFQRFVDPVAVPAIFQEVIGPVSECAFTSLFKLHFMGTWWRTKTAPGTQGPLQAAVLEEGEGEYGLGPEQAAQRAAHFGSRVALTLSTEGFSEEVSGFMRSQEGVSDILLCVVVGQALETHVNRAAHRLGLGPHVVSGKITSFFGTGDERQLRLITL